MNLKDIWGGKTYKSRSKVKWDFVTLPSGGLGIINPKAQCEALLAKLLMRGLSLRGELWKGILRHKAKHGQPHTSFHVVMPKDFTPLKFHKAPFTLWRGILGS